MIDKQKTVVQVRYAETDQMGVAYHGALIPWFEVGRTDLLRWQGMSYAEIEKKFDVHLAVVEASLQYRKRIKYDDRLVIKTTLDNVGKSKLMFNYKIYREDELMATGHTTHVCVDAKGKPVRWPDEVQQQLAKIQTV